MGGVSKPFPAVPFVEIVRFDVTGVAPGVTERALKLQPAFVGFPPHERVTALPKAALAEDTVTVTVAVVCPLATEMVVGETATEKSAGAAATFATNPSARPPPNVACKVSGVGKPVVLFVEPARYALLVASTAMAPSGG
jgi:hypothetical protein